MKTGSDRTCARRRGSRLVLARISQCSWHKLACAFGPASSNARELPRGGARDIVVQAHARTPDTASPRNAVTFDCATAHLHGCGQQRLWSACASCLRVGVPVIRELSHASLATALIRETHGTIRSRQAEHSTMQNSPKSRMQTSLPCQRPSQRQVTQQPSAASSESHRRATTRVCLKSAIPKHQASVMTHTAALGLLMPSGL